MSRIAKRWSAALVGTVVVVASCYDVSGNDSLRFIVPADDSTVSEPVALSVEGSGITQATFEVDGSLVHEATAEPFEWTLDPATYEGERSVTVAARRDGVDHSVSVTLTCVSGGGGASVVFALPAEGSVIAAPTTLAVQGTSVTSVEFFLDGDLELDDTAAPFAWVLDPSAIAEGDHQVRVDAVTAAGTESRVIGLRTVAGSTLAELLETVPVGAWIDVPNTHLDEVAERTNWAGTGLPKNGNVIGPWCSAAYDTKRERMICWGGGHGDYAGNELYAFDLASLTWSRLTNASDPVADTGNDGYYPDGLPPSRHTYEYIEYSPTRDRFVSFGGAAFWRGGQTGTFNVDMFDFATNTWMTKVSRIPAGYELTIGSVAAVHPSNGKAYYHSVSSTGRLYEGDLDAGTWRVASGAADVVYYSTMEVDPDSNLVVALRGGVVRVWDISKLGPSYGSFVASVSGAGVSGDRPGFSYDSVSKKFFAWNGGPTVRCLDTKTWTWASFPTTGDPGSPPDTGCFGKFRVSAKYGVAVAVTGESDNVKILRIR